MTGPEASVMTRTCIVPWHTLGPGVGGVTWGSGSIPSTFEQASGAPAVARLPTRQRLRRLRESGGLCLVIMFFSFRRSRRAQALADLSGYEHRHLMRPKDGRERRRMSGDG